MCEYYYVHVKICTGNHLYIHHQSTNCWKPNLLMLWIFTEIPGTKSRRSLYCFKTTKANIIVKRTHKHGLFKHEGRTQTWPTTTPTFSQKRNFQNGFFFNPFSIVVGYYPTTNGVVGYYPTSKFCHFQHIIFEKNYLVGYVLFGRCRYLVQYHKSIIFWPFSNFSWVHSTNNGSLHLF